MKPLIPIVVSIGFTLASMPLHATSPTHPLQPSAPRTVAVSESQTPPVIRAGLLQSTLIVLPAQEKVANVFAGDTVDWVFDGGHVASRFISVKPKTAGGSTDIHIVSDHGNEYTLQLREVSSDDDAHYDSKVLIEPDDKAAKDRLTQLPVFVRADQGRDLPQSISRFTALRFRVGRKERQRAWPATDLARRQVHLSARAVSGDAGPLRGEG
jgi:type IV secretory pathway VirB9-like protein